MPGWCGVHYVHHINPSRAGLKKASGAIKLQFLYNNYMFLQSVAIPFCSPQNLSTALLSKCCVNSEGLPKALVEKRLNLEDEAVLR